MWQNTFSRALAWVKELRQQNAGSVLIVLAGNKADLAAEHRAVSVDVGNSNSNCMSGACLAWTVHSHAL